MKNFLKFITIFSLCLVIFSFVYLNDSGSINKLMASYVYDNDKILAVTTDKEQSEKLNEITSTSDHVNVLKSKSVVSFEPETIDYNTIEQKANEVYKKGYEVKIDDNYSFAISDPKLYEQAVNEIFKSYLSEAAYQSYLLTGKVPAFTKGEKTYSEFFLSSKVTITESQFAESKISTDVDAVKFILLNGDNLPKYDEVTATKDIKQIKKDYNLTDQEFSLNNAGISEDNLTYENQKVVINKPEPVLKIVGYYESDITRDIPFQKFDKPDAKLTTGIKKVETKGSVGKEEIHYTNQEINGKIVKQDVVSNRVAKLAVNEITIVGTAPAVANATFSGDQGFTFVDGTGNLAWPATCHTMTSPFGHRWGRNHNGIDLQCGYGNPAFAADNGTVTRAGSSSSEGNFVEIDHHNGYSTVYMHFAQLPNVKVGDKVYRGQVIGYEGNTGRSTGHHLHYEVHVNGTAVNPLSFY